MLNRSNVSQSERGAVLIEAALTIPLFFLLVVSTIDLSHVLTEHLVIRDAQYAAARAGALQSSNCFAYAANDFLTRLSALSFTGRTVTFETSTGPVSCVVGDPEPCLGLNGAEMASYTTTTPLPVTGLTLNASVPSSCIVCSLFSALGGSLDYTASTFYPYESNPQC